MFEKVNPAHPDKVADRIAGALVDYAYSKEDNPRIAVEVLIGHGNCFIIAETSVCIPETFVSDTVKRIAGDTNVIYKEYPQDKSLSENQKYGLRCGDNGIFCGEPITAEQMYLKNIAENIYSTYGTDGKYIVDQKSDLLVICQSWAGDEFKNDYTDALINPLGFWTGGPDVDSGATNRKLGSDMGNAVTGGGIHGKDLSKADVSVNIYAHLLAQNIGKRVELHCAIGDKEVDGKPYDEIVEIAREYIKNRGGFEKFAEWGLI